MEATAATGKVAAFKVYTAWGPNGHGFALDDPAIGLPVIQKAHDLGVKIFVAHKGLPLVRFDATHNRPDDIVAVSRQFPDMQFVVFHGAWDKNHLEGPYDPNATIGIDTFLRALDNHAVPRDDNVWVDVGTVWREVLRDPTTAAHTLGKLLKRVGEHRVLWGTDAIWYGSPQAQLQAFRAFTISTEYQDRFGYPALTDTVKHNVLGLNAAKLFDLDAHATRCALASDPISGARTTAAHLRGEGVLPAAVTPQWPDHTTRNAPMACRTRDALVTPLATMSCTRQPTRIWRGSAPSEIAWSGAAKGGLLSCLIGAILVLSGCRRVGETCRGSFGERVDDGPDKRRGKAVFSRGGGARSDHDLATECVSDNRERNPHRRAVSRADPEPGTNVADRLKLHISRRLDLWRSADRRVRGRDGSDLLRVEPVCVPSPRLVRRSTGRANC